MYVELYKFGVPVAELGLKKLNCSLELIRPNMASRRMDTIKRAIDYYEKKESYDDAIKLLEKELNDPKDDLWLEERCELLERLAIFYHYISEDGDRARELEAITECIRLQKEEVKFKLNLSLKILGDGLLLIGDLGPASDYLHMGLACATDPNIRDLFYDSIAKVEAETKAKEVAEAASREKLRKELIEDEEKQKREIKDKMLEVKKQESTSSMEESTKEVEELVRM
ncbi:hypothetical protein POM88_044330 [Heracleum sosnowskyi]|uniref:Uncharacterized protein n=1 Tax=Heracleum sosnowskyi TaxID=360622 RepID=A0AAD8H3S2_9APIA|nr:hypothetical protein POM88_044330 [Heracleum sosnowskyi]